MQTVKLKLIIAYDGTNYQGWQIQTIGTGVQEKVEEALARLFPSRPRLHSSSRTDTGVHALGLVAHFEIPKAESRIPARKLPLALNAWLPQDIRVFKASVAAPEFHARFDAAAKEYRYYVWNSPGMNPLLFRTAWHVPRPLNLSGMRAAAQQFVGRHDFQSFTTNPGYARASTVRSLSICQVRRSGHLLTFVIRGEGFLYRMCRGIVGTLVQVGLGKFSPPDVARMLLQRARSEAGVTAPPHGLVLHRVFYRPPAGAESSTPLPAGPSS